MAVVIQGLVFSVGEVADKLGVSRGLINDTVRLRRLPSLKLGRGHLSPVDMELLAEARWEDSIFFAPSGDAGWVRLRLAGSQRSPGPP